MHGASTDRSSQSRIKSENADMRCYLQTASFHCFVRDKLQGINPDLLLRVWQGKPHGRRSFRRAFVSKCGRRSKFGRVRLS